MGCYKLTYNPLQIVRRHEPKPSREAKVVQCWMSVDPLVEKTMQPYSAFNNNPIRYNDPTGMIAEEGDPGKKSWLSRAWGEVKSWFSDKPKMKVNIEVGEGTWSYFEETLNGCFY